MSEVATDLLLYMSAQNELAGYAAENLKAINSCGSLDNISAYIMLDKFKDDQSRVTEDYAVPVGAVLNIQNPFVWPDKETSSPDVFKRFLIRARTHFGDTATRQKILVFWGHGGGLQMLDEQTKGAKLARASIAEFAATLEEQAQPGGNNLKFDVIGFDACYMCMIEAMFELRNATSFVLCSSTVVDARGYPYQDIISGLKKNGSNLGPQSAARFIADSYNTFYNNLLGDQDRFLFVCDVSKIKACVDELNRLGEMLTSFIERVDAENSVRSAISEAHISACTGISYVYVLRFFKSLSRKLGTLLNEAEHTSFSAQTTRLANSVKAAFQGNMGDSVDLPISPQIWAPVMLSEFQKFEAIYNNMQSSMSAGGEPGQAGWVSMWRNYHNLKNISAPNFDMKKKFELGLSKAV